MTNQKLQQIKDDLAFGWKVWKVAEMNGVDPAFVRKVQYKLRTIKRKNNDKERAREKLEQWKVALAKLTRPH